MLLRVVESVYQCGHVTSVVHHDRTSLMDQAASVLCLNSIAVIHFPIFSLEQRILQCSILPRLSGRPPAVCRCPHNDRRAQTISILICTSEPEDVYETNRPLDRRLLISFCLQTNVCTSLILFRQLDTEIIHWGPKSVSCDTAAARFY